jgi:hypothetical protein
MPEASPERPPRRNGPERAARPRRARLAALFQICLGAIFLAVFLSLAVQLTALIGSRGLLPLADTLERASRPTFSELWSFPTLFWLADSDAALRVLPWAGAVVSCLLLAGIHSRATLFVLWLLFLSCVTAGRDFFQYQWDNLLLESSFLALLLPQAEGLRGWWRQARPREPSPAMVFLYRWLLFRLLFESGWAKVASGDENWWNLTAMSYYYETAPLPSWDGWLVQQAPLWFHQGSVLFTFLVELLLAPLAFAPRRLRQALFAANAAFQAAIFLTSNYGYFNALAFAISLFLLEDRDLEGALRLAGETWRLARRAAGRQAGAAIDVGASGISESAVNPRRTWAARAAWAAVLAFVLAASLLEAASYFLPRRGPEGGRAMQALAAWRFYAPLRIVNTYHLFPGILRERIVVEVNGTRDGVNWTPYRFRHTPGDPRTRPPTTWLHNPRFAFHYSFLPLNRKRDLAYFNTLLGRLCCDPPAVAGLLLHDPFPGETPVAMRFDFWRYRFTDFAHWRASGEYWRREFLGSHRQLFTCRCGGVPGAGPAEP